MKKKNLFHIGLIILTLLSFTSCVQNKEKITEINKESLWTESLKQEFIKENSPTTEFEKFALTKLIAENEFEKNINQIDSIFKSPNFESFKQEISRKYTVVIDSLVGKTEKEIELLIGQPNKKEQVSPSGTPCPCNKYTYIYDLIEIVFINGKSDWITVNNESKYVLIYNTESYQFADWFEDYAYVKAFTK